MSITSLNPDLARRLEPRASTPALRLKTVEALAKAGIPVGIMIGPVLPGLNDHEIPAILKSAADAGAGNAYYTMLRLPYGVKDLFQAWLQEHFPDKAARVLSLVRDVRQNKLNNSEFGTRMVGTGPYAAQIEQMIAVYKKKYGLGRHRHQILSTAAFNRDAYNPQGNLFA